MKNVLSFFALITLFVFQPLASAEQNDKSGFALGIGAGSIGYSLSGTIRVTNSMNLRGVYATFEDESSDTEAGIDYDFEVDLKTTSLLLDWHPFQGGFRLTAGYVNNGITVTGDSTETTGTISIGDSTFNASDVGTLTAKVEYDSNAPYLGLGWGNAVKANRGFGFSLDMGVIQMSDPSIDYTLNGTNPAIRPAIEAELDKEADELSEELSDFDTYPIIQLGLSYQF